MTRRRELVADLNVQDDAGHGWSTLQDAIDPGTMRPGMVLVAGNRHADALVRILGVDADGQVHFEILCRAPLLAVVLRALGALPVDR